MNRFSYMAIIGAATFFTIGFSWMYPLESSKLGTFEGELILKAVDGVKDDQTFELVKDFKFIDANLAIWLAPPGIRVNGASSPQPVWSLIGGPWSGRYREASVIHDHFTVTKSRSWQDVHRVFYDAMLANGVPERKAQIMYYAVYRFGPRWTDTEKNFAACLAHYCLRSLETDDNAILISGSWCGACAFAQPYSGKVIVEPNYDESELTDLQRMLESSNMTLFEIEDLADSQFRMSFGQFHDAGYSPELSEALQELRLVEESIAE